MEPVGAAMAALGVVILLVALGDALSTTIAPTSHDGIFSGRAGRWLWTRIKRRVRSHAALRLAGLSVVGSLLVVWLVLTWAGWSLVFIGTPTAIEDSGSGLAASRWQVVYFVGTTMFTLGPGDYIASSAGWGMLVPLAALNGLLLLTLAVTFLVPVVSAVVDKRTMAVQIAVLGTTSSQILENAKGELGELSSALDQLVPALARSAQEHLAYPVLHYFHSTARHAALAPMLAVLDETLTLLIMGTDDDVSISDLRMGRIRRAIDAVLVTLEPVFFDETETVPPPPPIDALCLAGLEPVADEVFALRLIEVSDRRRALAGWVTADGWAWGDVQNTAADHVASGGGSLA